MKLSFEGAGDYTIEADRVAWTGRGDVDVSASAQRVAFRSGGAAGVAIGNGSFTVINGTVVNGVVFGGSVIVDGDMTRVSKSRSAPAASQPREHAVDAAAVTEISVSGSVRVDATGVLLPRLRSVSVAGASSLVGVIGSRANVSITASASGASHIHIRRTGDIALDLNASGSSEINVD